MFCQKGLIPWAAGDYKHVCCASRSKIHKKCFFDLVAKQTVRIPSSPVINQGVRMPNSFYKPREKKRKGGGSKAVYVGLCCLGVLVGWLFVGQLLTTGAMSKTPFFLLDRRGPNPQGPWLFIACNVTLLSAGTCQLLLILSELTPTWIYSIATSKIIFLSKNF